MRKRKVPKSVQKIVANLRGGKKLCRALRTTTAGETEVQFFYEPGGRRCGPKTAEKAIALGVVKPCGDALFPEVDSQTWKAA
jgi:hypothetical protein